MLDSAYRGGKKTNLKENSPFHSVSDSWWQLKWIPWEKHNTMSCIMNMFHIFILLFLAVNFLLIYRSVKKIFFFNFLSSFLSQYNTTTATEFRRSFTTIKIKIALHHLSFHSSWAFFFLFSFLSLSFSSTKAMLLAHSKEDGISWRRIEQCLKVSEVKLWRAP